MNDNELESFLRELPGPALSPDWRGPILASARREAKKQARAGADWPAALLAFLRLLRHNPVTAGGLAALWIAILILKTGTPTDPMSERMMARIDSGPPPHFVPLREEIRFAEQWQDETPYPPRP